MRAIYAHENLDDLYGVKIFLAGPTPRDASVESWRRQALELFKDLDGYVFVPEPKDGKWLENYNGQIEWELKACRRADIILFWIPRDLQTMPAFTTNVEFGMYITDLNCRLVYGRPDDAPKMRYLDYLARREGLEINNTLEDTIKEALSLL